MKELNNNSSTEDNNDIEELLPDVERDSVEAENQSEDQDEVFIQPHTFDENLSVEESRATLKNSDEQRLKDYENSMMDENETPSETSSYQELDKLSFSTEEEAKPSEYIEKEYHKDNKVKKKRKINIAIVFSILALIASVLSYGFATNMFSPKIPIVMEIQGSSSYVSSVTYLDENEDIVTESASQKIGTPIPFTYRTQISKRYTNDIVLKSTVRLEGDIPVELSCRIMIGKKREIIEVKSADNEVNCTIPAEKWNNIKNNF